MIHTSLHTQFCNPYFQHYFFVSVPSFLSVGLPVSICHLSLGRSTRLSVLLLVYLPFCWSFCLPVGLSAF
jgi:hypothetical protein